MTLDLAQIIGEIGELVAEQDAARDRERFDALRHAWSTVALAELDRRLVGAKTSFLIARGGEYREEIPEPALLDAYTVIATDGSLILPNRHSPARFYVVNIGMVSLSYGECPSAALTSRAFLRFGDDELIVPNDVRRLPVNEAILGLRRAVDELAAAAELAERGSPNTLALQDGTLLLWRLDSQQESVKTWVLDDFVERLRSFQQLGVPVASYISAPGSTDLMNGLRISVCDYPPRGLPIDCDACRGRIATEGHSPACDILPSITDRALLADIANLSPGSRTPVYCSDSKIISRYVELGGEDLEIRFFYVHSGYEIGRVEAPRWVTDDPRHLDLLHAVVLDQCRLGRGYPVVLQEAHEQAVIGMEDRRIVEHAVERALARAGVVLTWTGKDGSKRGRFV